MSRYGSPYGPSYRRSRPEPPKHYRLIHTCHCCRARKVIATGTLEEMTERLRTIKADTHPEVGYMHLYDVTLRRVDGATGDALETWKVEED